MTHKRKEGRKEMQMRKSIFMITLTVKVVLISNLQLSVLYGSSAEEGLFLSLPSMSGRLLCAHSEYHDKWKNKNSQSNSLYKKGCERAHSPLWTMYKCSRRVQSGAVSDFELRVNNVYVHLPSAKAIAVVVLIWVIFCCHFSLSVLFCLTSL